MTVNRWVLLWLLGGLLVGPARWAEADPAMDRVMGLEEVVSLAVANNAGFRAELARRAEVEGGVIETAADAWPQVEVISGWNRARNPSLLNSPDFEDILDQFPDFEPGEQELWNLGVSVEQPIWSGGKVRAALDLAKLVVEVTDAQIDTVRLDLALEAAGRYYDVLCAERAIGTLTAQRLARQAALDVVEARYELSAATELERLRAVAALAEVEPAVARAEGRRQIALSQLRALVGMASGESVELLDPRLDDGLAEPPSLSILVAAAFDHRTELRDLSLQGEALERQRVTRIADGRPQIDLTGAYGRQVRLIDDLPDGLFADWRLGIGLRWSVFDGGRRRGQVAQIDAQRDQVRWRLEEVRRQVVAELESGLAAWRTAREIWLAAGVAHRAAAEAARVADENYRLGVALQADLLDAQERAVHQELATIEAFYDWLVEDARLHRSVGLMPTEPYPSRGAPAATTEAFSEGSRP